MISKCLQLNFSQSVEVSFFWHICCNLNELCQKGIFNFLAEINIVWFAWINKSDRINYHENPLTYPWKSCMLEVLSDALRRVNFFTFNLWFCFNCFLCWQFFRWVPFSVNIHNSTAHILVLFNVTQLNFIFSH